MLVTPDFASEDSHANRVKAEGLESILARANKLCITKADVISYYEKTTTYPEEVTPGVLQSMFLQDFVSNNWQSFPSLEICNSYGYADNLEQLESHLLRWLDNSKRIFCVSVYDGEVNKEKPRKDGYHILTRTCDDYGGKVLLKFLIWEKVK